jgi:hypothetical protein
MQEITWRDGKAVIPRVEFYLNNTCNLTCDHCNRFNNHHFTGWQDWKDYEADIRLWAKYIEIDTIVFMGGEPLLNPSIIDWVKGINEIFGKRVNILTNGTRLTKVKGLYDLMTWDDSHGDRNWIGVSWHNLEDRSIIDNVKNFLVEPITETGQFEMGSDMTYADANYAVVRVYVQNEFGLCSVIPNGKGHWTLWNNDPNESHKTCSFHLGRNYHMIKGKLYKCGPAALLPEFDEQHTLDISEEDRQLLYQYEPLSPQDFETRGKEFLDNINDVIPQCKFCPIGWQNDPDVIYPTIKNK